VTFILGKTGPSRDGNRPPVTGGRWLFLEGGDDSEKGDPLTDDSPGAGAGSHIRPSSAQQAQLSSEQVRT